MYIYIHVYIDIQHTHPISSLKEKEQASESERERKKEICIKELVHMIVEAGKLKICRVDRTSKVCVWVCVLTVHNTHTSIYLNGLSLWRTLNLHICNRFL